MTVKSSNITTIDWANGEQEGNGMSDMVKQIAKIIITDAKATQLGAGSVGWITSDSAELCAREILVYLKENPTKTMFDAAMPHMDSWSSNRAWWDKMMDGALA